jgi:hypothetical protein
MARKQAVKPSTAGKNKSSPSIAAALDRLEATLKARNPQKSTPTTLPGSPAKGKLYQLPMWPEARRGMPNALVRGALFTVGNCRQKRVYRRNMVIAALGNTEVNYTGEELRQDDEDVFLQIVHLARLSPLGTEVEFTAHSLLKALGWPTNSRSYDRLRDTITRLSATGLEVRSDNQGYSGSLIRDFQWKEPDGCCSRAWKVGLEPKIVALFGHMIYTQIDWSQRLRLGNLAKWLHSFYYTHTKPFPLKVETIHRLCGSNTQSLPKFRQLVKRALDELIEVGFLERWELDSGTQLIQVVRASHRADLPHV